VYQGSGVSSFLNSPGQVYVQGCVWLPPNFPADAFLTLSQEFFDGTSNPLYNSQGDWTAFVQLKQSTGDLVVSTGPTPGASPTAPTPQTVNLGAALQKQQWYFVRLTSDLAARKFVSFQIQGSGLNLTQDLSAYNINWPQNFNVDNRAISFFAGANRTSAGQGANPDGAPMVVWDQISGGIPGSPDQELWRNYFDSQTNPLPSIFVSTSAPWKLANVVSGRWYLQGTGARAGIYKELFAVTPPNVAIIDANLFN